MKYSSILLSLFIALVLLGAGCSRKEPSPFVQPSEEPRATAPSATPRATPPTLPPGVESSTPATPPSTSTQTPTSGTHSVSIRNFMFFPPTLTVKMGDTVMWDNGDDAPHTVTSNTSGAFASALLRKGQTFIHTFTAKGTFDYYCEPHPWMKGQVVVE